MVGLHPRRQRLRNLNLDAIGLRSTHSGVGLIGISAGDPESANRLAWICWETLSKHAASMAY